MTSRLSRLLGPLMSLALLAGALYLLERSLHDVKLAELWQTLRVFPRTEVIYAIVLTIISHAALTIYDYIGVRYVKRHLGYFKVALAAFAAYSISHSLGFPAITGGAVRYRLYSRWGVSAVQVAQIMAVAGITLFLGMFLIGGIAMLLDGARVQEWTNLPAIAVNVLGVACLAVVGCYATMGFIRRTPLQFGNFTLAIPSPGFAAMQIAVSGIDWLLAAMVLYVLLPHNEVLTFATFLGVFVLAYLLGTLSNVPGGLGVFESVIIVALHQALPTEAIVSSLLVYRAVYHLLPLAIGGTIFVVIEMRPHPIKRAKKMMTKH